LMSISDGFWRDGYCCCLSFYTSDKNNFMKQRKFGSFIK
jgi:hypothetical protein